MSVDVYLSKGKKLEEICFYLPSSLRYTLSQQNSQESMVNLIKHYFENEYIKESEKNFKSQPTNPYLQKQFEETVYKGQNYFNGLFQKIKDGWRIEFG